MPIKKGPDYFDDSDEEKIKPNYFKKDPTKKISNKHEKDVAERSGGKTTPGSGNIVGRPGDVKDDIFLRECKATHGSGTQLDGKWLQKISLEALVTKKIPLLELRLEGQKTPSHKDWVMIPAIEFQRIIEKFKEDN